MVICWLYAYLAWHPSSKKMWNLEQKPTMFYCPVIECLDQRYRSNSLSRSNLDQTPFFRMTKDWLTKTRRLKELFTFRYGISPLPRSCGYFSRKFPHQVKRRGGGRKEGGINIQIILTFLTQEKNRNKRQPSGAGVWLDYCNNRI